MIAQGALARLTILKFWQPPATLDYADPEIPCLPLFTRAAAAAAEQIITAGHAGRRARAGMKMKPGIRDEQDLLDLLWITAKLLN